MLSATTRSGRAKKRCPLTPERAKAASQYWRCDEGSVRDRKSALGVAMERRASTLRASRSLSRRCRSRINACPSRTARFAEKRNKQTSQRGTPESSLMGKKAQRNARASGQVTDEPADRRAYRTLIAPSPIPVDAGALPYVYRDPRYPLRSSHFGPLSSSHFPLPPDNLLGAVTRASRALWCGCMLSHLWSAFRERATSSAKPINSQCEPRECSRSET